jgi:hypothetical protein
VRFFQPVEIAPKQIFLTLDRRVVSAKTLKLRILPFFFDLQLRNLSV